jgi:hypothetical protein
MDQRPILIPLGGFLGAGKTTLILSAARLLRGKGLKVAAILNDQGSELVDTKYVQSDGVDADQVSGGCFCCRFSELIETADRVRAFGPAVIFAEAVGSCTDISATTLRPLKMHYSNRFRLAAYSVLADPGRAQELMGSSADPDLAFLFRKQIDEADLICFTKSDLYRDFPKLTGAPVRYLSPLTGEGVAAWLDEILSGEIEVGTRTLEIDYDLYAGAETSLAWLNCSIAAAVNPAMSPAQIVGVLLDDLDAALTAADLRIAHLKLIDTTASGYVKASIVKNGGDPGVDGMLDASPAVAHELLLNVRVTGDPENLRRIVEAGIAKIPGQVEVKTMRCFSPAAPKPEWRFA